MPIAVDSICIIYAGLAVMDDYMLLSTDKKTKADTVLATRVESAVIETYINLAAACGLKL